MNRAALVFAAAYACSGCNAITWSFDSSDASAPVADGTVDNGDDAFVASEVVTPASTDDTGPPPFGPGRPQWGPCVDGGCWTPGLHCDVDAGECFPCINESGDCKDTSLPFCDINPGDALEHLCVQCIKDGDCGANERCVASQCVATCETSAVCKTSSPFCDPTRGICVGCRAPNDCQRFAGACNMATGRCVRCANDSQCPPVLTRCDPRRNECVQCLGNGDCGGGRCDPQTLACVSQGGDQ